LPATNRLRQPGQAQKYSLKNVVGIGGIVDQTAGRAQHHRPVPVEKEFEGSMVVAINESPQ
jgi:hypothetical protein